MKNIKPRYNYYLNEEPFGNNTAAVIDALNLKLDRSHKHFYNYIGVYSDLIILHWADWDVETPKGRLVRILRNEDEVLKSRTKEQAQRIKNVRDAYQNKRRNS